MRYWYYVSIFCLAHFCCGITAALALHFFLNGNYLGFGLNFAVLLWNAQRF